MTASSALLVEDFALVGDGDNLVWLPDNPSERDLLLFLAAHADSPCFGSPRRFSTLVEATLALSTAAVEYLRSSWASRVGEPELFDGVPISVPYLADVPELGRGVPRFFVLSKAPRYDEIAKLKRLTHARYSERVAIFPAAMPALVVKLLRREAFYSTTRFEWEP